MHILKIYYRPDNYPDWLKWREFNDQFGVIGSPSAIGTGGLPTARPGFAPRLPFGKPPDNADALVTNRNLRRGFNFQMRFVGSGYAVLDRFRLHAQKLTEKSRGIT